MSTWVAAHVARPIDTDVWPSTCGSPMSTVMSSPSTTIVFTPSRVCTGMGSSPGTRPSATRCRAKTRMPLPHISETDPSAFQ